MTSEITGLTALGPTNKTGVAHSRNDVVITATSPNSTMTGFKYIVRIQESSSGIDLKWYIEQNLANSLVFNLKGIMENCMSSNINVIQYTLVSSPNLIASSAFIANMTILIYSGYDVAGVFTEDTSDLEQYDLMILDGIGDDNYMLFGTTSAPVASALSEWHEDTFGFSTSTERYKIATRNIVRQERINWFVLPRWKYWGMGTGQKQRNSHYRALTWMGDDGTYVNSSYPCRNVVRYRFSFYDYNESNFLNLDIGAYYGFGCLYILPTGLQNLVEGGYITETQANNTWYYFIVGVDDNDEPITAKYGYYVDSDCDHNEVSLSWLNRRGGWDSFAFIKKNERTINTEKKRYLTNKGDYATASFDTPYVIRKGASRDIVERTPSEETLMTLTTDWMTESEFRCLASLIASKEVWMQDTNYDGGMMIPVVIEDTSFTSRRERNYKKYNQTIRLKLATNYRFPESLNGTLTPIPITPTNPCIFGRADSTSGGSSTLQVDLNVQPITVQAVNATGRRYRYFHVVFDDNTVMENGQNYCVKIDWDSEMPTELLTSNDYGFICIGTGSDIYSANMIFDGNAGLTTGWQSCYNSGANTENVYIELPRFPSKSDWTGTITITIKKISNTCECGGY